MPIQHAFWAFELLHIFTNGAPQGSVLGPTLVLLSVNYVSQHIHLGVAYLCAHDHVIYCMGSDVHEVSQISNKALILLNNGILGTR